MKNVLIIFSTLIFIALILFVNPKKVEAKDTSIEDESMGNERNEQIRQDSLAYYLDISDSLAKQHQLTKCIPFLDSAIYYSSFSGKDSLFNKRADYNISRRKYNAAITDLTVLVNHQFNIGSTYYKRAKCYQRKHLKQETVNDLRLAIQYGNSKAKKLYDKINPIRKRVSYYVTRCCDGSTSNSKGRGTCSYHRGVCNWNEPVYETYRKY